MGGMGKGNRRKRFWNDLQISAWVNHRVFRQSWEYKQVRVDMEREEKMNLVLDNEVPARRVKREE